jgi:hypothetical protein
LVIEPLQAPLAAIALHNLHPGLAEQQAETIDGLPVIQRRRWGCAEKYEHSCSQGQARGRGWTTVVLS